MADGGFSLISFHLSSSPESFLFYFIMGCRGWDCRATWRTVWPSADLEVLLEKKKKYLTYYLKVWAGERWVQCIFLYWSGLVVLLQWSDVTWSDLTWSDTISHHLTGSHTISQDRRTHLTPSHTISHYLRPSNLICPEMGSWDVRLVLCSPRGTARPWWWRAVWRPGPASSPPGCRSSDVHAAPPPWRCSSSSWTSHSRSAEIHHRAGTVTEHSAPTWASIAGSYTCFDRPAQWMDGWGEGGVLTLADLEALAEWPHREDCGKMFLPSCMDWVDFKIKLYSRTL